METPLEKAMRFVIGIYHKYSVKLGGEYVMRKRNLKELIQNEMNVGPISQEPEYQRLMEDLDRHGDIVLRKDEFLSLVAEVLALRYKDE